MIQIMTVGSQLYILVCHCLQDNLCVMLSELPEMVTVFERFFQLEYSESYPCKMHGQCQNCRVSLLYAT